MADPIRSTKPAGLPTLLPALVAEADPGLPSTPSSAAPSSSTSAPAAVVAPAANSRERMAPSYFVGADGKFRRDLPPRELSEIVASGTGNLWVDIDSDEHCQHALLEKVFRFHPLSVEDTLSINGRVKVEEFEDYLFVVLRVVKFCDETEDPYDLETANLYLFIGRNFLVTVHAGPRASLRDAAALVTRSPDVLARGVARLAHVVMDTAVDEYFPILERIDEFVDGLEQRVFADFDQEALQDIFQVKRLVLSLRRYLAPQREIFTVLANRPTKFLPPDLQVYFRDVYDHVLRINDSLETFRELLSSTMDAYLTQVSNRLSHATKGLSAIATISIPFVVVSGMFGMNFERIPLSGHPYGFWLMLVAQLAIGVVLLVLLRWRKLI